jgi:hypothetical protein
MDMDGNGWIWIVIDGYGWIWMGMDGYGWICMLWIDMDGWMWMDGSSINSNGSNSSSLLTFTPPAPKFDVDEGFQLLASCLDPSPPTIDLRRINIEIGYGYMHAWMGMDGYGWVDGYG